MLNRYVEKRCKCKWLCPVCSFAASWADACSVERRIGLWLSRGGQTAMLTLTQSHSVGDPLSVLWTRLDTAWGIVTQGSPWMRIRRYFGIAGYVRITEVMHNSDVGWNPHFHVVLFLNRSLQRERLAQLETRVAQRFQRAIRGAGGQADCSSQRVTSHEYGARSWQARYPFKGLRIHRTCDGGRSPMAILDDLEASGEGLELWTAFAQTAFKHRHLTASQHLEEKVPIENNTFLINNGKSSTPDSRSGSTPGSRIPRSWMEIA
ncbi:MAG: protein rep [Mycobacteriaceae bacterium]|nr:protein rep [Mycobacteriaceae bacterium]